MPHKQQDANESYVYLNVFAVYHHAFYLRSNEAVEKPDKNTCYSCLGFVLLFSLYLIVVALA